MKSLIIDTHSAELNVALVLEKDIFNIKKVSDKSHSEYVIDSINSLLSSANVALKDLTQIIVINGPGSFTGVRIGVTIAKTIAYSLNIPIKTITSLEAFGISDIMPFDIITIEDSKGVYSAIKKGNIFSNYEYRRKKDFENYIKENSYVVSTNKEYDYIKILEYLKDKVPVNPHVVNPVYIKEIDALK